MNRWKLLRYERGHEVSDVSRETGVSIRTIYRLETGKRWTLSAANAKALADYYGVPVAEVLGVERAA